MKFAQISSHWLTRMALLLGIAIGVLDLNGCALGTASLTTASGAAAEARPENKLVKKEPHWILNFEMKLSPELAYYWETGHNRLFKKDKHACLEDTPFNECMIYKGWVRDSKNLWNRDPGAELPPDFINYWQAGLSKVFKKNEDTCMSESRKPLMEAEATTENADSMLLQIDAIYNACMTDKGWVFVDR